MTDRPEIDGLTVEKLRRIVALFPFLDGSRKLKDLRVEGVDDASEFLRGITETVYPGKNRPRLYAATKGVGNATLTGEGQRLLFYARMMTDTARRYESEEPAPPTRTLCVYSDPTAAAHVLPWALGEYLPASGYEYVGIHERDVSEVVTAVAGGVADLGVTVDAAVPSGVARERLLVADRCFVARRDYLDRLRPAGPVLTRDDLARAVLVTYHPAFLTEYHLVTHFPKPKKGGVRVYVDTTNVMYAWAGYGVAVAQGYQNAVQPPTGVETLLSADFDGLAAEVFLYFRTTERPLELDRTIAAILERCRRKAADPG